MPPAGFYQFFRQHDGTLMHVYWHLRCRLRVTPRPCGRSWRRHPEYENFGDGGFNDARNPRDDEDDDEDDDDSSSSY
jgi:hypothetical protein